MKYLFLFLPFLVQGQAAKTIVVEHFTNTRCGSCAGQNPSFYTNLANNPQVKHISYHPSSPFSNCLFSQHNPSENDARTNFYGLFGSTPRLTIQGSNVSNSPNPFQNPNLYNSYQGQTSAYALKTEQRKTTDSIFLRLVVKTVAASSLTSLRLYAGVAEDTVFYNAPNGESIHHDVFRKSFFGTNGLIVNPAASIGDSVVFESKLGKNNAWNFNRIFAYAILQNATTRALEQAAFTKPSDNNLITNTIAFEENERLIQVFPNPSTDGMFMILIPGFSTGEAQIEIQSLDGKFSELIRATQKQTQISLINQAKGIYSLKINYQGKFTYSRLVKI